MFLCLLELTLALVLVVSVILFVVLVLSDADLLLVFASKWGKQPESLAGKVVWITGASSGIGEYMAYCLAQAGCKLVISARRKEELERVKQTCLKHGKNRITEDDVLVLPLDMVDFSSHKPAVQKVIDQFNKIDILVNNAGRSQRAKWLEVDLNVDRSLFETNVLGSVSLTQEVLPHMIQRKQGLIAVTSSIVGKMGFPLSRSYTGTKHALHGYFECLRTEMSDHNIDITMLCPGPVFSQLFVGAATAKDGETVGRVMGKDEKRMTTERCAYLSCVAIANKLYEAWICQQPLLTSLYVAQYLPDVTRWLARTFGVKLIMRLREGKSLPEQNGKSN